MEGSVLNFLKSEWKVGDTGSAHWASSSSYYQYIAHFFFANCIDFDPVCWLEFYIQLHKDKSDWSITYGNHKNETKITTRKNIFEKIHLFPREYNAKLCVPSCIGNPS